MNKSELEHIAAAYYEEIYLFCLRKVNYDEHLARDLVQDVFLLLLERHGGLTNTNLRAWLYSVADKKIKEAYKKEKKVFRYNQQNIRNRLAAVINAENKEPVVIGLLSVLKLQNRGI